MRKLVAIITLHYSFIYGGLLQCFALQQALRKLGMDTIVVDYRPKRARLFQIALNVLKPKSQIRNAELLENQFTFFERITKMFVKASNVFIIGRRNLKFIKKHMSTTRAYYTPEDLEKTPPKADAFVCGSDQIWNTSMPFEKKEIRPYFLTFAPDETSIIAYAPSMGGITIGDDYKEDIQHFLSRFSALSAREQLVVDECRVCGYQGAIPLVLDPALLLDKEDYYAVMGVKENDKTPYLCSFFRQAKKNDVLQKIKQFNTPLNRPWVDMSFDYSSLPDKYEFNRGPINWLNRINHAQHVITDSFHATAYSLIFHTDFHSVALSMGKEGSNNRLSELLGKVGLQDRLVSSEDIINNPEATFTSAPIDWEKVDRELAEQRERSLDFLREALK